MQNTESRGDIDACKKCAQCLLASPPSLPHFALANYYYYGLEALPPEASSAFQRASPFDLMLVSRCRCARITHRFSENIASGWHGDPATTQGYSCGNTIVLLQDLTSLHTVLPPEADEISATMCALFVGKTQPSPENIARLHPVLVSKQNVFHMIAFLLRENPFYRGSIAFSQDNLDALFDAKDSGKDVATPQHVTIDYLPLDEVVRSSTTDYTDCYADLCPDVNDSSPLLTESVGYTDSDFTPQNYVEMKAAALSWCRRGQPFIKSQSGTAPMSERDEAFLTSVFLHLDPYGIGSLTHPKRLGSASFFAQVQHLVQLHNSPFERDPNFAYICWNIITKAEVNKSICFQVGDAQQNSIASDIHALSPDVLDTLTMKWKNDPLGKHATAEDKLAFHIMRKLKQVSSSIKGSAGSKIEHRNQIRGVNNVRGTAALFTTINPFDLHHPLVRVLTSEDILYDELETYEPVDKFHCALVVAEHPAAAVKFFDIMVNSFITHVLQPQNPPGLFGHCIGYYGMVEAQGRGTLHLHMLIWLEGNLNPQALRDKLLVDPVYAKAVCDWLDATILTSPEIRQPSMDYAHVALEKPVHETGQLNPCAVYAPQIATTAADEFESKFADFVRRLAVEANWHVHSDTCWKYLQKGQEKTDANCRMGIDGTTRSVTSVDPETGALLLRRLHPCINSFNDLVIFLIQCNMDIKHIGSGEAAKAFMYYVTDYITKASLLMHVGLSALSYAIRQNDIKFSDDMNSPTAVKQRSLIAKAVNVMMGRLETSHQQVMSWLVGSRDHYKSDTFNALQWGDFDRFMLSAFSAVEDNTHISDIEAEELSYLEPEVVVHFERGAVVFTSQVADYRFRPTLEAFEKLSVWEMISLTERTRHDIDTSGSIRPTRTLIGP